MTQFRRCANHASPNRCEAFSAGFSLIEVMVAMVIALLGVIVMAQVFIIFEGQRRTTTGGSDAITSGAIALYGVQRDIQQSGWGISAVQLIGCTIRLPSQPAGASIPLVPATINSPLITGQDANTDTLLLVSGNGNGTVEGDIILAQTFGPPDSFVMTAPTVFSAGDRVVAIRKNRPSPCTPTLTDITGVTSTSVTVTNGDDVAVAVLGPRLFNLGTTLKVLAYAIRNGNLTVCDYWINDCGLAGNNSSSTIWMPIANDIVSLRAEYGRDTNAVGMDGVTDVWDQTVMNPEAATPTQVSTIAAKNTRACGLIRVSAVRLALVARSSQPEKAPGGVHVTAVVPAWAGNVAISNPPSPDATWPTWQDFRYKVFQTVVPLRNVTSIGVWEEC